MIQRLCLCLALLVLPGLTSAGAWPRAEGHTFIANGFGLLHADGAPEQNEQTVYFERGLKKNRTLGFSGSLNMSSSGEGHIFLRLPPRTRANGALTAIELGIGVKSTDLVNFRPFVKAGLSWSKSVTLHRKAGWLSVDNAILWDLDKDDHRLKIDATLGLNLSERFKLIGQGFFEATQYGSSLTLAPSLVYRPRKGRMSYKIGVERKQGDAAQTGVRFAIWTEF